MAPLVSRDRLELPNDFNLIQLLDRLGLRLGGGEETGEQFLSREACEEAGVSFEFFEAFARLTKASDWRQSSASKLFLKREERRDASPLLTVPSWDAIRDWGETVVGAVLSGGLQGGQEVLDQQIDIEEGNALGTALAILDQRGSSSIEERINDLSDESCWLTPEAMRIGIFGVYNGSVNPVVTSLTDLMFGTTRTASPAVVLDCPPIASMEEVTPGLYFKAEKIPPPIQRGSASIVKLEFGEKEGSWLDWLKSFSSAHAKILYERRQRSAQGPVMGGSGVSVLSPGYFLTARHTFSLRDSFGNFVDHLTWEGGGRRFVRTWVTHGGKRLEVTAEVLFLDGNTEDTDPDLAVLYIPELAGEVPPIEFSKKVVPIGYQAGPTTYQERRAELKEKLKLDYKQLAQTLRQIDHDRAAGIMGDLFSAAGDLNPPIYEGEVYREKSLWLGGYPAQGEGTPKELLLIPGTIEVEPSKNNKLGKIHTTAVAIPGISGGAALDQEGGLAGIVTNYKTAGETDGGGPSSMKINYFNFEGKSKQFEPMEDFSPEPFSHIDRIAGSKIYSMAEWGPEIQRVIEEHRQ